MIEGNYELKIAAPSTTTEDLPRPRTFSHGRCWKYLTSCSSVFNFIAGLYAIGAAGYVDYIINYGIFNPDPNTDWGKRNHTIIDYGVIGGVSIVLDIALLGFAVLGAGVIVKTCYGGIKEGRVQRGETPLLDDPEIVNAE